MERSKACWIGACLALALVLFTAHGALCAKQEFSAAQLEKMGTFISNFSELGLYSVDASDLQNPDFLIGFGIWHIYRNDQAGTRAKPCARDCPWGALAVDGKAVAESIEKYFGVKFTRHRSVDNDWLRCHWDGLRYHFGGADGEENSFARVLKAGKLPHGFVRMEGVFYHPEAPEITGASFTALAKPSVWRGKPAWTLVKLESSQP
ncbi:MAG: hypothetical protein J5863_06015 [Desulfovibrio sp.]|nr:hypothetical protein [Desulfovibrio sp.]